MDISKLQTKSDVPCCEGKITEQNLADAMLIQCDYGGEESELTAILTYIYQSYIVKPYNKDISNVLEKIAMQEMRHHETLGDMIVALGGNPIIGDRRQFWSGKNINYTQNLTDMLLLDIKGEEIAIANYRETIKRLQCPEAKKTIECIIADEKIHIETLSELLKYTNFWK